MYVCGPCVEEHNLETSSHRCVAACEVCGHLRGDWEPKCTIWAYGLSRFGRPVAEQLEALRNSPAGD